MYPLPSFFHSLWAEPSGFLRHLSIYSAGLEKSSCCFMKTAVLKSLQQVLPGGLFLPSDLGNFGYL